VALMDSPEVREFLKGRGCPDDVVEAGIDGLITEWEHAVEQVNDGYPLGLDDYLNDLDGRQLLEEALDLIPAREREKLLERLRPVDQRMKLMVTITDRCLWGDGVVASQGWTPEDEWWYFSVPRNPGPLLREDLKRA
jgi:hypothetical protein